MSESGWRTAVTQIVPEPRRGIRLVFAPQELSRVINQANDGEDVKRHLGTYMEA